MKKTLLLAFAFSVMLCASSCLRDGSASGSGNGGSDTVPAAEKIQQEMVVEPFDEVSLDGSCNVVFELGDESRVRIEGPKEDLAFVNVYVEEEVLHIADREKTKDIDVTVYVYTPVFKKLALNGAGNVSVPKPIKADNCAITLSGAGNITIADLTCRALGLNLSGAGNITFDNLTANQVDTNLSGAGNVKLNGKVDRHNDRVTGSGTIDTSGLR